VPTETWSASFASLKGVDKVNSSFINRT
jgi:hypothetical protein